MHTMLEILRDDVEASRRAAEATVALTREHGLALYLALGALPLAWARAKLGDRDAGSAEFRQALAEYARQGNKFLLPFYRGLLAEIEAESEDADAALAGIDGALALAGETGEHWFDAGLHRIRGEILLKQNPADPALAEAAFLAAIAFAQQQKARSFELRAALSLANLYRATGRDPDARAALRPALEGFSPTPEFPEVGTPKHCCQPSRPTRVCESGIERPLSPHSGHSDRCDRALQSPLPHSSSSANWRRVSASLSDRVGEVLTCDVGNVALLGHIPHYLHPIGVRRWTRCPSPPWRVRQAGGANACPK